MTGIVKGEIPIQHYEVHADLMLNGCPIIKPFTILEEIFIFRTCLKFPHPQVLFFNFSKN